MNRIAGILCIIVFVYLPAIAHNEMVAEFIFQSNGHDLFITANLEKRHLTLALKSEGDCTAEEMMKVCGNEYVNQHFTVFLNHATCKLVDEGLNIGKDYVTYNYFIDLQGEDICQVRVDSDYMLQYNDHGITRVAFALTGFNKIYSLSKDRRSITASIK